MVGSIKAWVGSLLWICMVIFPSLPCFAEQEPGSSASTTHSEDVSIIHVDQLGVYVPNRIFYWDEKQGKSDLENLRKQALKLKNSRASITYSSAQGQAPNERPLIVSIETSREPDIFPTPEASSPGDAAASAATETQGLLEDGIDISSLLHTDGPLLSSPAQDSFLVAREEITSFVQNLLNLNNRKDIDAYMKHFGDRVDYHGSGLVSKDHVRRDTLQYFNSWNSISNSLENEVVVIVTDERQVRIAKFLSRFHVRNSTTSVKGLTENIWTLRQVGDRLLLVGMEQRVLSREILPP